MTLRTMPNKALIIFALLLSGCASNQVREVKVTIPPTYSENLPIPRVEPTTIKPVDWQLMDQERLVQLVKDLQGSGSVVYVLNQDNMAIMIDNLQDMKRYIQSQQEVINYLISVIDARRHDVK